MGCIEGLHRFAQGAKAVVWRLLKMKERHYYKTFTTALAGDGKAPPFGGWRHHLARWEACHWIRGSRGSPMSPVPLPPPLFEGALWVLSSVPHDSVEERRAVDSVPRMGESPAQPDRGWRAQRASQQNSFHVI